VLAKKSVVSGEFVCEVLEGVGINGGILADITPDCWYQKMPLFII